MAAKTTLRDPRRPAGWDRQNPRPEGDATMNLLVFLKRIANTTLRATAVPKDSARFDVCGPHACQNRGLILQRA
eukprot:3717131-Rhodomonas_salina.7